MLLAQHGVQGVLGVLLPTLQSPLDALMERGEATNPPVLGVSRLESTSLLCNMAASGAVPCWCSTSFELFAASQGLRFALFI